MCASDGSRLVCGVSTAPLVVVAGGAGFVGRRLSPALRERYGVRILSRRENDRLREDGVEIKRCDLFSLLDVEAALKGARLAVYLVHSMLPVPRLTQANFADQDLLIADNFARAAVAAGIERIVYLGGLIPANSELSEHLRSRREVEETLAARGTPVTAIRAGLVLGAGGSSFEILEHLVRRLPAMVCPQWTKTPTQAVAVSDVVATIVEGLQSKTSGLEIWNIGAEPPLSYLEMMQHTAAAMGKRRWIVTVPFDSWFLSRIWVRTFSGAPYSLVGPLVESMRHPMLARPNRLAGRSLSFDQAIRVALQESQSARLAAGERRSKGRSDIPERQREVRSIQRMPLPAGKDAAWAIRRFAFWIDRSFGFILHVRFDRRSGRLRFVIGPLTLLELQLSAERSSSDRMIFYIVNGLLVKRDHGRGRLEFRIFPEQCILLTAIHEFRPALPWYIYSLSQAPIHQRVMQAFGRYLDAYSKIALRRRLRE